MERDGVKLVATTNPKCQQRRVYLASGQDLLLDQPITEGGEAKIHKHPSQPRCVIKFFHQTRRDLASKLVAMAEDWRTNGPIGGLDHTLIWPGQVIYGDAACQQVVGYSMPRVDDAIEWDELANPILRKLLPWNETRFRARVLVCRNLLKAEAALERRGHVYGDYNPRNALINQLLQVFLIDCDSAQIKWQGNIFPSPCWTDEFSAPENQGGKNLGRRGPETAWFSLAVMVFKMLYGVHPFPLSPNGKYKDLDQSQRIIHAPCLYQPGFDSPMKWKVPAWEYLSKQEQQFIQANLIVGQKSPQHRLSAAAMAALFEDLYRALPADFEPKLPVPRSVAKQANVQPHGNRGNQGKPPTPFAPRAKALNQRPYPPVAPGPLAMIARAVPIAPAGPVVAKAQAVLWAPFALILSIGQWLVWFAQMIWMLVVVSLTTLVVITVAMFVFYLAADVWNLTGRTVTPKNPATVPVTIPPVVKPTTKSKPVWSFFGGNSAKPNRPRKPGDRPELVEQVLHE